MMMCNSVCKTEQNKYINLPQIFLPWSIPFVVKIVSPRKLS